MQIAKRRAKLGYREKCCEATSLAIHRVVRSSGMRAFIRNGIRPRRMSPADRDRFEPRSGVASAS
jgi:hypothetical protein